MQNKEQYSPQQIIIPLATNWFSCVTVVLVNKFVFRRWPFGTTLSAIHFVVNFIGLSIACHFKVFDYKKLSILKVFPLAFAFCFSIFLNNLSIQFNPIGTYQTLKIAVTPCVCMIEMFILKIKISLKAQISMIIMLVGIGLCTISRFDGNNTLSGFLIGLSGVIATAMYQIMSKTKQKELNCNEYQLLLYETPLSALILWIIVPFIENYAWDDPKSIWHQSYTSDLILAICFTALMSTLINISLFVAIKRTSALTYNIVSNMKTVSILLLGTLMFKEKLSLRQVIGMIIAVFGVICYSSVKMMEAKKIQQQNN